MKLLTQQFGIYLNFKNAKNKQEKIQALAMLCMFPCITGHSAISHWTGRVDIDGIPIPVMNNDFVSYGNHTDSQVAETNKLCDTARRLMAITMKASPKEFSSEGKRYFYNGTPLYGITKRSFSL